MTSPWLLITLGKRIGFLVIGRRFLLRTKQTINVNISFKFYVRSSCVCTIIINFYFIFLVCYQSESTTANGTLQPPSLILDTPRSCSFSIKGPIDQLIQFSCSVIKLTSFNSYFTVIIFQFNKILSCNFYLFFFFCDKNHHFNLPLFLDQWSGRFCIWFR